MVKINCLCIIYFWFMVLYGLKTEGRRLMVKQLEFSCGSDSRMLMNCVEDVECKLAGYRNCLKGNCCPIIALTDHLAPQVFPPTTTMSSASDNELLVVIEEMRVEYSLMPPLPHGPHPTTIPRQLGDKENDERVDDMNDENSEGTEWYNKSWGDIDESIGGIPQDLSNNSQEKKDDDSSAIVYDDKLNNKHLEKQDDEYESSGNVIYGSNESAKSNNLDSWELKRPLELEDTESESIGDGTGTYENNVAEWGKEEYPSKKKKRNKDGANKDGKQRRSDFGKKRKEILAPGTWIREDPSQEGDGTFVESLPIDTGLRERLAKRLDRYYNGNKQH